MNPTVELAMQQQDKWSGFILDGFVGSVLKGHAVISFTLVTEKSYSKN